MNGSYTTIDGYTQTGSAPPTTTTPAEPKIEINGSLLTNNNCLDIATAGNVIRGLVINGCTANGIYIHGSGATGNRISGNLVGTNYNGFSDSPNIFAGVFIGSGASGNTIGGDEVSDRNLISGNRGSGIKISGAGTNNNVVSGNYIGTFPGGNTALPNVENGIQIDSSAQYNIIGGGTPQARNIISGNGDCGVALDGAHYNAISGNYIGTDTSGLNHFGSFDGILLTDSHHNFIGGETPGSGNLIAGNLGGISLVRAEANTIQGNTIGLAADGLTPLGNVVGISIQGSHNTIGGTLRPIGILSLGTDMESISPP